MSKRKLAPNAEHHGCNAVDAFECILALRDCLRGATGYTFLHEDIVKRCHLQRVETPEVCCLLPVFDIRGLLHDGLSLPDCGHLGKAKAEHGGDMVYHGTKDLFGVLQSNGVLRDAINTADGKKGWYHGDFMTALQYAHPIRLGRASYKPVLKVRTNCWNVCKSWGYTKSGCVRYSMEQIIMAPECCFPARPLT
jgi:hypothetical protein